MKNGKALSKVLKTMLRMSPDDGKTPDTDLVALTGLTLLEMGQETVRHLGRIADSLELISELEVKKRG